MKLLALERAVPGIKDDQFTEEILETEARKAWELYQSGVLRELYLSADKNEAVLVLECGGVGEARSYLAGLPLVKAGLIEFEVIPLMPYPGFARLFSRRP